MEFSTLNGYKVKDKKAIRYYDTVNDMKSDTTLKNGMFVKTKGYYSINDDGDSFYHISNTEPLTYYETLNNNLYAVLIKDKDVRPEQYGAYGDSVHDDTESLQSAINENKLLVLQPNKTYVISDTLTINNDFTTITSILNSEYTPVLTFNEVKTDNTPILEIKASGCNLSNICFKSNLSNSYSSIGILFDLDDETHDGNIDSKIENITFLYLAYGISIYGRNVKVNNCNFTATRKGISLNNISITSQLRGYDFKDNRFHACTNCIENTINANNSNIQLMITNNFVDECRNFYNGYSNGLNISNNYITNPTSFTSSFISLDNNIENSSNMCFITSNFFNGLSSDGETRIRNAVYINNNLRNGYINISNNNFTNFDGSVIYNNGQRTITIINNNVFNLINSLDTNYAIEVLAQTNRGMAMNNITISSRTASDVYTFPSTNYDTDNNVVRNLS